MRVKGWVPRAGGPGSKRRVSFSNRLTGKWNPKQTTTKKRTTASSHFTAASLQHHCDGSSPLSRVLHSLTLIRLTFIFHQILICSFLFFDPPNEKTLNHHRLLLDATSSSSPPPTRSAVQRDAQLRRHYPSSAERGHRPAAQTLQAHSR